MPFMTADLVDADPQIPSCDVQFRSFGRVTRFCGTIRTVRCLHDNALIRRLLSEAATDAVLVVDGAGSLHCALAGDRLVKLAIANGWKGIVIHGAIRDSTTIDTLEIGVKALGTNPRKSANAGTGEIDIPVAFGGVTFTAGSYLYSDPDGIVIASRPLKR